MPVFGEVTIAMATDEKTSVSRVTAISLLKEKGASAINSL
jgi:hypothetical protein